MFTDHTFPELESRFSICHALVEVAEFIPEVFVLPMLTDELLPTFLARLVIIVFITSNFQTVLKLLVPRLFVHHNCQKLDGGIIGFCGSIESEEFQ